MKNLLQLLLLVLFAFPLHLEAQRECATMDHLHQQQQNDPTIIDRMQDIEDFTNSFIQNQGAAVRNVVTIPVVFHVVYKANAENISDAQLISQLDVLNEDFRRTNGDATNKWGQAADTEIEFCLATVDPDGNPTTGIQQQVIHNFPVLNCYW